MMTYKEAILKIEEHQRVHHMQEQPRCQKITEALSLAIKVLELASERKLVSDVSVYGLVSELRSRDTVIAVQLWTNEDIIHALRERYGIDEPSSDLVNDIADQAQAGLEDCEHGWDAVYSAIDYCVEDSE